MINENKSDEEIKDYVSTRFGVDSLYEPALTEDTYFLWFAPFILLLITLLVFFLEKLNNNGNFYLLTIFASLPILAYVLSQRTSYKGIVFQQLYLY